RTHSTRLPISVRTVSPLLTPRRWRLPASRALRSAIWPNVHVLRLPSRVSSTMAVPSLGAASTMSRAKFTVAHLRAVLGVLGALALLVLVVLLGLRLRRRPRAMHRGHEAARRRARGAEAPPLPVQGAGHHLVGVRDAEVARA